MFELLLALILQIFGTDPRPDHLDAAVAVTAATTTAQVVRVIDGDTIEVQLADTIERVRYIGIDTPEVGRAGSSECYAAAATQANQQLVGGQTVKLVADQQNRDEYGRLLRYVYVDDTFVNLHLASAGYARKLPIPPNDQFARDLAVATQAARATGRGLWGVCE